MAKDFYEILGIKRGASADEIKKAYRTLSKELHPDKHPSTGSGQAKKEAERKFKEVNEAYEVLSNPQKRQMYDQFGNANMGGAGGPGGGFGGANGFGGFDFSNFAQGDGSSFSDLFEGFFGGQNRRRTTADEQGQDREMDMSIDFADIVTGVTRVVRIRRLISCDRCEGKGAEKGSNIITCPECGGTGQVTRTAQSFFGTVQQRMMCPRCRGSGKIPEKACSKCSGEGRIEGDTEVTVNVPAGIHDGQTLRLRGEGDAGRRGAASGDLFVHIHVKQDARFERDGDDIRTETFVSVVDATLGTTITVETVQGEVQLKVPEGTQPGSVLRIKGKGLPVLSTNRHGDHYVTVNVKIPTKISRAERKLLEEWRNQAG